MICACGHRKSVHLYIRLIGDNSGRCLLRHCPCEIYEENR